MRAAQLHLHIRKFAESMLVFKKLGFPENLKQNRKGKKKSWTSDRSHQRNTSDCTHPSPMASTVIAFKQTVYECAAAALDQRVRVSQL